MYGYEMIVELTRRSQNVFEMKEGTLYPVPHILVSTEATSTSALNWEPPSPVYSGTDKLA